MELHLHYLSILLFVTFALVALVPQEAVAIESRKVGLLQHRAIRPQDAEHNEGAEGQMRFAQVLTPEDLLHAEPQARLDRIVSLPGQPKVSFAQYSGYVTVDEKQETALFYWLTEAEEEAGSKPLLLWLNGGPGCSSVAYGASEELGPFRVNSNGGSLYRNHYSWNKVANLLFLESPAGVGFSYSNSSAALRTGDSATASQNLQFLLNWFERFPEYKHREFYISGESYAGHYVPQLTKLLYEHNRNVSRPIINLKGFLVGNAVTDNNHDSQGLVDYWWTHAIISDESYKAILAACNFSSSETQPLCLSTVNSAVESEFGNIDMYSIYSPRCARENASQSNSRTSPLSLDFGASSGQAPKSLPHLLSSFMIRSRLAGYDPCSEYYSDKYYNQPEVQHALHANATGIRYPWTPCSGTVNQNWQDSAISVLPIYRELIAAGLRIWVFSGDTDAVVPVTGTRYALNELNLPVKTRWYPWYHNSEVGGWTIEYDGLTFATVRGAGHEVPDIQPSRALAVVASFIRGQPLPKT